MAKLLFLFLVVLLAAVVSTNLAKECDDSNLQKNYRGAKATTRSGLTCKKWTTLSADSYYVTPAKFPNKGLGDHNYCRNPDSGSEGTWCYTTTTTSSGKTWEYCDVPTCQGTTVFHGSQVFIYPKTHVHSKLGTSVAWIEVAAGKINCERYWKLWSVGYGLTLKFDYCPLTLDDGSLKSDQIWSLVEHPSRRGYYYVKSWANNKYRLSYGTPAKGWFSGEDLDIVSGMLGRNEIGNMNSRDVGPLTNNDLFSFESAGNGYYYIRPGTGTSYCMVVEPASGNPFKFNKVRCSTVRGQDKALWRLEPRFKLVSVTPEVLFDKDNLQGSTPLTGKITITHGVVRTDATSVRNKHSFKQTVGAALTAGMYSASLSLEFSQEVEETVTSTTQTTWQRAEQRDIHVPAGKKVAIVRYKANLEGKMPGERFDVRSGRTKKYETSDGNYRDDDGNVINIYTFVG